jgi:N-acetylglutamate synthase-like GNAT family acetyltransferase
MDMRRYAAADRVACLDIFDSLIPALLAPAARPLFESWLDSAIGRYVVMEHENSIVGCGGYSFSPDESMAILRWGMIHRSSQGMGLGRFLLMYRIREIGRSGASSVVADVPRPSAGFYEKQGFRISRTESQEGTTMPDCVELVKKLTVCP